MFIGDFEKAAPWSSTAVKGCKRFLDRVWNLAEEVIDMPDSGYSPKNEAAIHRTIKKVGEDIESLKFNTAIASLMSLVNDYSTNGCNKSDVKILLTLLNPFAPHITEELWERLGGEGLCCEQSWPEYDEAKTVDAEITIAVQINGKLRTTVTVPNNSEDSAVLDAALKDEKVKRAMEGKTLVKTIVVKNKLINLILKDQSS